MRGRRSVRGAALAAMALVLVPVSTARSAPSGPADVSAPGCAPTRPAVAHHAGGALLVPQPSETKAPIPCAVQVGTTTETATIGVSSNGSVFYAPIVPAAAPGAGLAQPSSIARSRDEGATWTTINPSPGLPHTAFVPWMHLNPASDRIWYATVGVSAPCAASIADISWSDDDGATWQGPGAPDCRQLQGGMSVVEGPAPAGGAQPVGYPHVVYHCGNVSDGGAPLLVHCWKTLDGGATWTYVEGPNGIEPSCTAERPRGKAIGPDGTFYMSIDMCGTLGLATSRDEGATWSYEPIVTTTITRLDVSSLAVDTAGNLYIGWVGEANLPHLLVSEDGGETWRGPLMIGAPGVNEATAVGVTASRPGHVALSYLASTDGGANFNGFITESRHALGAHPVFWSSAVNDPAQPLTSAPLDAVSVHGDRMWLITAAFGPDDNPWAAFHCAHTTACPNRVGIAARLVAS